jgi:hypothetical protein
MSGGVVKSVAETIGMPASQLSDTYYFPWYAHSVWVDTELRIANVGNVSSDVTITIGTNVYGPVTIKPQETYRPKFPGLVAGPIIIEGTAGVPLVASERMAWKVAGNVTTVADMIGLPDVLTDDKFTFPWYVQDAVTDTELRIANVGNVDSDVNILIGDTVYGPFTVEPDQTLRKKFAGENAGPMRVQGTVAVPLAVTQRLAWKVGGNVRTVTEMLGLPDDQAADTLYFAWYTHDSTAQTVLRITNIGGADSSVDVTIGGVGQGTHVVPVDEAIELEFPGVDAGPMVLEGDLGVPIVATQLIKWNWNGQVWSRAEVMTLPDGLLDTRYFFPWYAQVIGKWTQTELRLAVP